MPEATHGTYRMSAMRLGWLAGLALVSAGLAGCGSAGLTRLDKSVFADKCRGAWAGQMIGVCYGDPYQFKSNGRPITEPMQPWSPERVAGAIRQDDVYVEQTFLAALEKHGLDITPVQAGQAFAETTYALWHANRYGRDNIRHGIMPPASGHPDYNRHADDIDFQIEADVFGVICPGLPRESNRLCDLFGHIMNYGDGVYGGMFVAGMYTEAFFESDDVHQVIRAGLACIPAQSTFAQCMRDTLRICRKHPNDWLAAWHEVEERWNDDIDCIPGNPHNIDAKINAAYIVMGLFYGEGDLLKSIEISTRCGQDADSSTANVGGVIGCMKGYAALGDALTGGIPAVADQNFRGTPYSFNTLTPACERMAEAIVRRTGGQVTEDAYLIARQTPRPPATLETWPDKKRDMHQPMTQHEVNLWNKNWQVAAGVPAWPGGFYPRGFGDENVLALTPLLPHETAALLRSFDVPAGGVPKLIIEVASDGQLGPFVIAVTLDGKHVHEQTIHTSGEWTTVELPLSDYLGKAVQCRLDFRPAGWYHGGAYLRDVRVEP